jgi:hypothetical protein
LTEHFQDFEGDGPVLRDPPAHVGETLDDLEPHLNRGFFECSPAVIPVKFAAAEAHELVG